MKKTYRSAMLAAAFALIIAFSGSMSAQTTPPMVGGYKTMAVDNPQIIEAANFAMNAIAKSEEMEMELKKIHTAQYQAGQFFNFKMLYQVVYFDGGEEYELCLTSHVNRSIKKEFKLVSWDSTECPKPAK